MSDPDEQGGSGEASPELELFRDPSEESAGVRGAPEGPPPAARASRRRVIAVSGAKGGVGKSVLATNLAIYFATIGRKVVIADADGEGGNVHTFLGVERPGAIGTYVPPVPSFRPAVDMINEPFAERVEELARVASEPPAPEAPPEAPEPPIEPAGAVGMHPVEVPVPGLSLLHCGVDEPIRGAVRRTRRSRLLTLLEHVDAEYIVLDLGSGTDRSLIDLWLAADLSIFVTLPEPTAIEHTYRFVRAAFARHLLGRAPTPDDRRRLVRVLRGLDNTPSPLDLARSLEVAGDPLAQVVRRAMADFRFPFVLNQTRVRADLELGQRMRSAAYRRLGIEIDYIGYIDYDDTVWTCARSRRPLMVESPGSKASKSIEKIARRLMAIDAGKDRSRPMRTVPPDTHHDLLEVDRGATDEEIRRAYKRAREVYAPESLCRYGLFDATGLEALRARLDEAYDVLLDPVRRRPYELSVFPPDRTPVEKPHSARPVQPRPPAPLITPDTEFTGALLRAVRESQGVELKDVAETTKIGLGYLRSIEADAYRDLPPAVVYVRGFVAEVAKCLKLDAEQVARSYVRRYRRYLESQENA